MKNQSLFGCMEKEGKKGQRERKFECCTSLCKFWVRAAIVFKNGVWGRPENEILSVIYIIGTG